MNRLRILARSLCAAAIALFICESAVAQSTAEGPDSSKTAALFGDNAGRVEISGFVDTLAAYTYSNPDHWSRGVARLQVSADGALANNVKWKVGGRVDVDPTYFSSNFYLDPVKKDQRVDFFYRENYVDVSLGDWDIQIGAQQIVWGEVVGIFVADVVSARDLREFLLPSFDIIRIPQPAVRVEYFVGGDSHLEFVWIPVPVFDNIGKPGSDFYPARLPSPTSSDVAELFHDPVKPSRSLSNSNYGVRANGATNGFDWSVFYYRSFSAQPTFYREAAPSSVQSVVYQPRYDRIWQIGTTLGKDLGEAVLHGEVVYSSGQSHAVTDASVPNGAVEKSTLDYALSLDFPLPADTRLNVQAFQRIFTGGTPANLAVKTDGFGASVSVSTKLSGKFEPQLTWLQNFKDGGGLIRPRLNWYPAANTTIGFGVDIFTGPSDGFFGRYNNRDRVYAELRYDFQSKDR
jgi:hypothetical protein